MAHDVRFTSADGVFELRAAAIIVCRPTSEPADARVLMTTNPAAGYVYSIGGAVEFGETTRQAVAREVLEETGVALPIGDLAAVEQCFFTEDGRNWHVVAHHYWVDAPAGVDVNEHSVSGFEGAVETSRWLGATDFDAVTAFPAWYRDALAGHWPGVRWFVKRDRRVHEPAS